MVESYNYLQLSTTISRLLGLVCGYRFGQASDARDHIEQVCSSCSRVSIVPSRGKSDAGSSRTCFIIVITQRLKLNRCRNSSVRNVHPHGVCRQQDNKSRSACDMTKPNRKSNCSLALNVSYSCMCQTESLQCWWLRYAATVQIDTLEQ